MTTANDIQHLLADKLIAAYIPDELRDMALAIYLSSNDDPCNEEALILMAKLSELLVSAADLLDDTMQGELERRVLTAATPEEMIIGYETAQEKIASRREVSNQLRQASVELNACLNRHRRRMGDRPKVIHH